MTSQARAALMRLRESVNGMRHGAIMGGERDYLCGLIYSAIEGELAALPAEAEASEACRECDGAGAVTCTGPTGEFADQWQEPCPECSVDEKDELQLERKRHAEVQCDGDELLPCPFCGGAARFVEVEAGAYAGGHFIGCSDGRCGASTDIMFAVKDDPKPHLREKWNSRSRQSVDAPSDKVLKSIEEMARDYDGARLNLRDVTEVHQWLKGRKRQPSDTNARAALMRLRDKLRAEGLRTIGIGDYWNSGYRAACQQWCDWIDSPRCRPTRRCRSHARNALEGSAWYDTATAGCAEERCAFRLTTAVVELTSRPFITREQARQQMEKQ